MIRRKFLIATAIIACVVTTACADSTAPAELRPSFDAASSPCSATGHVDCVDQHGDNLPGNIFGEVTSWRMEGQVVVLNVTGKLVRFPRPGVTGGHPVPVSFTVKIQQFGGAGVGHWTLEVGGRLFCVELLTSGQIVYRPE